MRKSSSLGRDELSSIASAAVIIVVLKSSVGVVARALRRSCTEFFFAIDGDVEK